MLIFPRFLTFYHFLSLFLLKCSYPELSMETHAFKACTSATQLFFFLLVVVVVLG